jgi:hypothetical protein
MEKTEKKSTLEKMLPMILDQDEIRQARIMGYVEGLQAGQLVFKPTGKKDAPAEPEEKEAV